MLGQLLLKSGLTIGRITTRRYRKAAVFSRFKPFLSAKHKAARLKWAKKHLDWTLDNWSHVTWTDKATVETGLDTRRKGTAMESRYLKPTFKSGKSSTGIWGVIVSGFKGSLQFFEKEVV